MKSSNTCQIDNGLTIVNLFYKQNETFRGLVDSQQRDMFTTLLILMLEGNFAHANLVLERSTTHATINICSEMRKISS